MCLDHNHYTYEVFLNKKPKDNQEYKKSIIFKKWPLNFDLIEQSGGGAMFLSCNIDSWGFSLKGVIHKLHTSFGHFWPSLPHLFTRPNNKWSIFQKNCPPWIRNLLMAPFSVKSLRLSDLDLKNCTCIWFNLVKDNYSNPWGMGVTLTPYGIPLGSFPSHGYKMSIEKRLKLFIFLAPLQI